MLFPVCQEFMISKSLKTLMYVTKEPETLKGLNVIFFGVFLNKSLHVIDIFFYKNIYIAKLLTTVIFIYIYECISWWSFELKISDAI